MIAFLWALSLRDVRRSILDLLKIFFGKKIIVPFLIMLFYVFLMVIIFKKVGFWDESATKDTILWTLGTAIAAFFSLNKVAENEDYFKNAILDNIKFILILEFVVNLYSFNLAIEMVVIPVVSFIVMMNAYAGLKPEYKQVKTILDFALGLFGLFLLIFTFRELIIDFQNFATLKNLRDFFLPPLFSIAFLPLVYVMALIMQYESFFTRVDFANQNSDLAKYAKWKIFVACHVNLSKLNKLSKSAGFPKMDSKDDVLALVKR